MCNDKVLLITGASSDVGRELIKRVSKNYRKIWAHYRNSGEIIEEMKIDLGDSIIPIRSDFSDVESTYDLIRTIKESGDFPNHIVHLSGIKAHSLQFHKQSWENYRVEIDISLRSITMILHEFIPNMAKSSYGKVLFMLSSYLLGVPPKFQSSYITVKYALLGLMRSLAAEYASKGIMVNAVSPDMIETKFLSELPELIMEQNAKNNPLKRNLLVDDVVPTMEFLLSSESGVITGQNIGITGGVR